MEGYDVSNVDIADNESCISFKENNPLTKVDSSFLPDMENDEATKEQRKSAAISELKTVSFLASQPSLGNHGNPLSSDSGLVSLMKERDQYRQQAVTYVKMMEEMLKEQQAFVEKAKQYHIKVNYFQQEQQRTADTIKVIQDRYRGLQSDAEQKILEADERIDEMQKQHDNDAVTMRYKLLQQEVKMKSLDSQIRTLQTERLELLDMCDELVAKTGGRLSTDDADKTVTIVPLNVPDL
uniref:Transforming acidic coiled-coil-containing protein C-terminal domain-containing protein n=1 Tax=Panagrolaimus sp. ES5 TaxID=591445 RepID=A0AC34F303_9BILA